MGFLTSMDPDVSEELDPDTIKEYEDASENERFKPETESDDEVFTKRNRLNHQYSFSNLQYDKYDESEFYKEIIDLRCLKFIKPRIPKTQKSLRKVKKTLLKKNQKINPFRERTFKILDFNPLDPVRVIVNSFIDFLKESIEEGNRDELEYASVDALETAKSMKIYFQEDGGCFGNQNLLRVLQAVANMICGEDDFNSLVEMERKKNFVFLGSHAFVVNHSIKSSSGEGGVELREQEESKQLISNFFLDFSFNEWLSFCGEVRYNSQPQNRQRVPNLATVVAKVFERFDPSIQKQELLGKELIIFQDSLYSDSNKLIQPWTDLTQIPPRQHLKAFLINREDFEGSNKLKFRIKAIPTSRNFLGPQTEADLIDTIIPVDITTTVDELLNKVFSILGNQFRKEFNPVVDIVEGILLLNHYKKSTCFDKIEKKSQKENLAKEKNRKR